MLIGPKQIDGSRLTASKDADRRIERVGDLHVASFYRVDLFRAIGVFTREAMQVPQQKHYVDTFYFADVGIRIPPSEEVVERSSEEDASAEIAKQLAVTHPYCELEICSVGMRMNLKPVRVKPLLPQTKAEYFEGRLMGLATVIDDFGTAITNDSLVDLQSLLPSERFSILFEDSVVPRFSRRPVALGMCL